MRKKVDWKVLLFSFILVYGIAVIGSLFTSSSVDSSWYNSIKPILTPPNWVFPVVWNILFFMIALSLYFSFILVKTKKEKQILVLLFSLNFLLNVLWSFLFFGLRNPLYAFVEIFFLWFSILSLVLFTFKISKKSAYLLVPYLLWVGFAILLNYLSI